MGDCEFEVLLSCMYQDDFTIAYKTKVDSDLLIINQCNRDDYQETIENGHLWRMISTTERGLSRSRNTALKNARGKICLFCDDDEEFCEAYDSIIVNAFRILTDASLIAFNVHRVNVPMKKEYYHITSCKKADGFRSFGGPMVAFKRDAIIQNRIMMNEMFGSGSLWGPGEDTLFLNDCRKAGLLLYECPEYITTIDYSNESKWFHGYTEEYFYNQGAFSEYCETPRLKRELYNLYSSYIKLRKEKQLSPLKKIRWRHIGEKGWKKGVTYSEYVANGYKYESDQP